MNRTIFGAIAVVVGLMFILALHTLLWNIFSWYVSDVGAALAVIAVDLVVALLLGWFAMRGIDDPIIEAARQVRSSAVWGARREVKSVGGLLRHRD